MEQRAALRTTLAFTLLYGVGITGCLPARVETVDATPALIPTATATETPPTSISIPTLTPTATPELPFKVAVPILQPPRPVRNMVSEGELRVLEQLQLSYASDGSDDRNEKFCKLLSIQNKFWEDSRVISWPTYGPIATYFSGSHKGIDISPPFGTPIAAAHDGLVVAALKWNYSYGHYLMIYNSNDLLTLYAHMDRFNVELGQVVTFGQLIGSVGRTGRQTGPHLHFETYKDCQVVDPLKILPR